MRAAACQGDKRTEPDLLGGHLNRHDLGEVDGPLRLCVLWGGFTGGAVVWLARSAAVATNEYEGYGGKARTLGSL